jgi:hypothetical protein
VTKYTYREVDMTLRVATILTDWLFYDYLEYGSDFIDAVIIDLTVPDGMGGKEAIQDYVKSILGSWRSSPADILRILLSQITGNTAFLK